MFHWPPVGPSMFIWYFAPTVFASAAFLASAAGRSSLKSLRISTDIRLVSSVGARSESRLGPLVKRAKEPVRGGLLAPYSVSPAGFRLVQPLVGKPHQRFGGSFRIGDLVDRRVPHADRDAHHRPLRRNLEPLDGGAQALREAAGVGVLDPARQDDELLPPEAREHV